MGIIELIAKEWRADRWDTMVRRLHQSVHTAMIDKQPGFVVTENVVLWQP